VCHLLYLSGADVAIDAETCYDYDAPEAPHMRDCNFKTAAIDFCYHIHCPGESANVRFLAGETKMPQ
jgi:hypothetical protein